MLSISIICPSNFFVPPDFTFSNLLTWAYLKSYSNPLWLKNSLINPAEPDNGLPKIFISSKLCCFCSA
jgi:hypothetical protein